MSVSLIARRYATALLELGSEMGQLDALSNEMDTIGQAYESTPELQNVVENPLVAIAAKKATLAEVADRLGCGPTTKNTVMLLIDRRRMKALPYIARYLRELSDAKKGVLRAEVTTAAPLSDAYYAKLQAQLEKMTGKRVVVDKKEDASLIAGVVTRIGDRIFDGSLRSRLASMKDAMFPQA